MSPSTAVANTAPAKARLPDPSPAPPAAQLIHHIGKDVLLAGSEGHAEGGRLVVRLDSLGHKLEIKPPGLLREVRHRQLATELARLHDHRQGLPAVPLQ